MASQFDKNGKYFAQLSTDGKLKIWDTISNSFEQEFTPDFHLTTPCTCLQFLSLEANTNKNVSPKKKKKRESFGAIPNIALGTTSGVLLVYSIAKAGLEFTIDSKTSQSITCLSEDDGTVYCGAEQSIIIFNLHKKTSDSKWKVSNEKITSILIIPDTTKLITASKTIKLWNIPTKQILKTFTGHSSEVSFLQYINPKGDLVADSYLISASKGDRLLSCWNLNESSKEKNAVASFLMEDTLQNLSIVVASDGSTNMAATIRNGVVHVFQHTLNGKCSKPVKPKTTIQVVSDTGQDVVSPIQVFGAIYRDESSLCIGYGTSLILTFENIEVSIAKKVQCLLRKDPRSVSSTETQPSKTKTPLVSNDVHYLTPHTNTSAAIKRKNDGRLEVPMEKRLENLTLNKLEGGSKVPKSDNVAQLLLQGLHSKDKNIIRTVLCRREENIISNTVKRLPMDVIVPLLRELTSLVQGKTISSQVGSLWLRHLIQVHAAILLSNPDLPVLLGPVLGSIESRLGLQAPLNRLRGRLELLVSQVNITNADDDSNEEALLTFNDKDSGDSDVEEMEFDLHSDSENEWVEESSDAEEHNEQDSNNEEENEEQVSDDDSMSS